MEPKADTGGKAIKKLSFCPLCMYSGSNNVSYLNHIMCGHYHANYRCGQCLNEVFTTGQQLKGHLKVCMGLHKEAEDCTPTSPEKEHTSKDPSPNLLPPPGVSIPRRRSLPQLPRRQTSPQSPANLAWKNPTKKRARSPARTSSTTKRCQKGKMSQQRQGAQGQIQQVQQGVNLHHPHGWRVCCIHSSLLCS